MTIVNFRRLAANSARRAVLGRRRNWGRFVVRSIIYTNVARMFFRAIRSR